jgi:hypothetical protein
MKSKKLFPLLAAVIMCVSVITGAWCVFRPHPDTNSGNIRTVKRLYPDSDFGTIRTGISAYPDTLSS